MTAKNFLEDATDANPKETQKVITELTEILCQELQMTSFEFDNSGLLKAIRVFLTMPPSQAQKYCQKDEESKSGEQVTRRDAKTFILRLRLFLQLMLNRVNGKVPFKQLLRLCQDQITIAEPLIFKDTNQDYNNQVEALRQLCKPIVINLVYEAADQNPVLKKTQSVPFSQLQSNEKSLLYLKRHALYEELKSIPLNIQKCDNIWLLEDFLLKRIRTKADVQKLISQTRMPGQGFKSNEETVENLNAKQRKLYQVCFEHIIDLIDDCDNEMIFQEKAPQFIVEITETILGEKEPVNDYFFELMKEEITQLIKESHQDYMEGVAMSDEEMVEDNEESREYQSAAVIQAKTKSFLDLIEQIKVTVKSVQNGDVEMKDENKEDVTMTEEERKQENKQKPLKVTMQQEDKSIEELVKQNQGEDIEINFYYNGKKLDLNNSVYEIFKDQKKEEVSSVKDMMVQLQTGLIPGYKTITFQIKDKTVSLQKIRGDSLAEYVESQRVRTKSVFVDDLSAKAVNSVVQSLLNDHFAIFNFDASGQEQLQNTLSTLKVMHFMYQNARMFTSQGLNLLLLQSQVLTQPDVDLVANMKAELQQSMFHHAKLDQNLEKAIQDPYQLVSGGISQTLRGIFSSCAFLFPFETKQLFFRLVSFIGVDIYRSLYFLKQHMKRNNRLLYKQGEREDKMQKMGKQKVKVSRQNIMDDCLQIMKQLQKRTLLEIEFANEEGTGLGPTLEFYTLISQNLRKDLDLWRTNVPDNSLYPKALGQNSKEVCEKFQIAGIFLAKSISDNRLIDLPISKIMWDLLLGKKKSLFDLVHINTHLYSMLCDFQVMANRKQEIDEMQLDPEMRKRQLNLIRTPVSNSDQFFQKGATIEDYGLFFYDPSNEDIELIKDGKQEPVNLNNLQHYIDLVLDSTFNSSVSQQLRSFKKGFSSVLPVETLRIFESQDEIEQLICGIVGGDAEWQNISKLQECIITAHGYSENSRPVKDFIRYLSELAPAQRQTFLRFVTGSPRLPVGGFEALEPHLTIVLKKPTNPSNQLDDELPSVMTCQNYIKMPAYSTFEILKSKFDYAIEHGTGHFGMS